MGFYLYCDRATDGGMSLIRGLKGKRIRKKGGRFRPGKWRKIINWGSTNVPYHPIKIGKLLNSPDKVKTCVDKSKFFGTIGATHAEYMVPYTFDKEAARAWIKAGHRVVARTILNGHSGAGIVIRGPKGKEPLPDAPLYTKYVPKDEEYRLHFIRTGVKGSEVQNFYSQKKVKRADFDGKHNRLIRCFDNGYIYQHEGIEIPKCVLNAAAHVFLTSRLDFGAVDVIYSKDLEKGFVLEINTAPGLAPQSAEAYAKAFIKYF